MLDSNYTGLSCLLLLIVFPRKTIWTFFLFAFWLSAKAQTSVKGKIYEAKTDTTIPGVNVYNLNSKRSSLSDKAGNYSISAAEGDQIVFSITGFKPDTLTVAYSNLLTRYDVTLHQEIITLRGVTVTGSYRADSIARKNYYSDIYSLPGITGRNTPSHGFGVSISPFSFFSKEAKQKRQLKRRLIKEEQEYYVDRSFPKAWVASVTGLHGDSLDRFMILYRPSYTFCRKTDRQQMLLYVNEKLKEFKKPNK